MSIWEIIVYIGALRVIYLITRWLYFNYYCKLNLENYKHGHLVITGASDGIGKALALELAHRGFKLILISRSKDKLASVASEITKATSNSNIVTIAADFSFSHRNPEEFYSKLTSDILKYEISGLLNVVGTLESDYLAEQSLESIEQMIGVNVYPQTMLSYYLLPKMIENHKKTLRRSLLVNFSSSGDLMVIPTTSVYVATKRYNDFLSEGLRYEYSSSIDVVTVKPGIVKTNMTSAQHGNGYDKLPGTVNVTTYAKSLVKNLHLGVNYGHWVHSSQAFFIGIFPHQVTSWLMKASLPLFVKMGLAKH